MDRINIRELIIRQRELYEQDPRQVDRSKILDIIKEEQPSIAIDSLQLIKDDIETENHPLITIMYESRQIVTLIQNIALCLTQSNDQCQIICLELFNILYQKLPVFKDSFESVILNIFFTILGKSDSNPITLSNSNFWSMIECIKLVIRFKTEKYYLKSLDILLQIPALLMNQIDLFKELTTAIIKEIQDNYDIKYNSYNSFSDQIKINLQFNILDRLPQLQNNGFKEIADKLLLYLYEFPGSIDEYNQTKPLLNYDISEAQCQTLTNLYKNFDSEYPEYDINKFKPRFECSSRILSSYYYNLRNGNTPNLDAHSRKCLFYADRVFFQDSIPFLPNKKIVVKKFEELLNQLQYKFEPENFDECTIRKFLRYLIDE